ncbi:MAG: Adenylate cyclase, partial [Candidatus Solibacter sp.]|nr:Adenylate cyclase [Candidatus Solibacter sp.]
GILHIPQRELDLALRDTKHAINVENFDLVSDLPELPLLGPMASAVRDAGGILWFATPRGVARIDPARIRRNPLAPPVAIRSVVADGKPYPVSQNTVLPPLTRNLRIGYAALSLSIPERVRARYKLEGSDKDWQDAGNLRDAFYTNLGPRKYTFRVIACNNDGIWNEAGASWNFEIEPAFYQTGWVNGLYVLAGATLIWLVYLLRLRQITARVNLRYTERLAERTRIARELHDTLLQNLAGVSLQLDGISKEVASTPDQARSLIDHVRREVDSCFRDARTKVWNLRNPELEEQGLEHVLRDLVKRLAPATTAHCTFTATGEPRPCPPEVAEELLLIAKEAANNATRHARPREIHVALEYGERLLRLRISDDGEGFDYKEGSRKSGHWGLKTMQERAAQIRGKCLITTAIGCGTQISVSVPLAS